MAKEKERINKELLKSMDEAVKSIFDKADARVKAGQEPLDADWQATLELMLLMIHRPLLDNPGRLLPTQIDGQDEWDFYLDIQEKLDLPPDTYAALFTPSAIQTIPGPEAEELDGTGIAPWERNAYSIIISDRPEHSKIMQASLPGIESVGMDVFEDGKHLANYTYHTNEECLDDLSNVTWTFFSQRGEWSDEQITRYTENWYEKSLDGLNMNDVLFHTEFSYVHHPELLNLKPLESIFKLLQATIPKDYDGLEKAIEITNDLNRDLNLGEAVVTERGILQDNPAECQALIGRIAVEIDMNLEALDLLGGVKMPSRDGKVPEYNRTFYETAKMIYKTVTGRSCPESVKVL
jgi:hypothetical protein